MIRKCDGYNKQYLEKNRDISENFCINDQILIQGLISHQHNPSVIYYQPFHRLNKPTFDRIDNNKSHTLENCVLCYCKCNQRRDSKSHKQVHVKVQKLKLCKEHEFPTTITYTRIFKLISKGVSDGNSFVSERYNVGGETHINRLVDDIDNHRIISRNTENIITDVCGIEFNSLYHSVYSPIKTNKITYTNCKLLISGGVKFYSIDKNKIASIIQSREEFFIVCVKLRIVEE
jgi:hypothetical protein